MTTITDFVRCSADNLIFHPFDFWLGWLFYDRLTTRLVGLEGVSQETVCLLL